MTGGTQYWILVGMFSTAAPTVDYGFTFDFAPPPGNDTCGAAPALTLNIPVSGTTAGAFNDYQLSGATAFTGVGQTVSTAPGRDVVYTFTAPSAGTYSFRLTGYSTAQNAVLYTASSCPVGAPPVIVSTAINAANPTASTFGFSIAAPVGPIGVLCIRRSLAEGRQVGLATGLGAATADAVYGCVAGFGLMAVSRFMVGQKFWLSLLGGLYLSYLGIRTFITKPSEAAPEARGGGLLSAYFSTMFLTLTNPMTILSFATACASFWKVCRASKSLAKRITAKPR
jgi:hypothetical protein